jgi:hypothetical protein
MDVSSAQNGIPIANPYIVGRPLTGASASLYVGREDVFNWFSENLVDSVRPNALLLYGRRRIGKTSTLYQLVEGHRGRSLRENSRRAIYPAYIDLQRLAGRPTDEWLRHLARDICRRVNTLIPAPTIPIDDTSVETAYTAFDQCLDRLEETLPVNSLILLAIDELEEIRGGIDAATLDSGVIPYLRSQIQHRDRIVFLLSGATGLLDPFWEPITNLTARWELEPLDYSQTVSLVRLPVGDTLTYEDAAVDAIWHRTAGHPFQIQTICHRLVSLVNRRHRRGSIEPQDVEHVLRHLDQVGFFDVQGNGASAWAYQLPRPEEIAGP